MHNGPDLFASIRQGAQLKNSARRTTALNKTTVNDALHRKKFFLLDTRHCTCTLHTAH